MDEIEGLLDQLDGVQVLITATDPAKLRAMATGSNFFEDAVYLEMADEIECGFTHGEYI